MKTELCHFSGYLSIAVAQFGFGWIIKAFYVCKEWGTSEFLTKKAQKKPSLLFKVGLIFSANLLFKDELPLERATILTN